MWRGVGLESVSVLIKLLLRGKSVSRSLLLNKNKNIHGIAIIYTFSYISLYLFWKTH